MNDIQGQEDPRGIALDEAGIEDLRCPIVVLDRRRERQQTVATIAMSVALPASARGTHMSRFVEVLEEHRGEITMRTLPVILAGVRDRLAAERARIEVVFPYFLERRAPVSEAAGLMDYECRFIGTSTAGEEDFVLSVRVPVTSLCPCSKAISDYGAHNQRGYLTIEVRCASAHGPESWVWIEELVEVAEASASCPVYPLLKRPDERHVTMRAYENPVFVEDMVRNVAGRLKADARISWFRVRARNEESIHNHAAVASTSWTRG